MNEREIRVGDPAPDFELMNQDLVHVRLADFKGRKRVVLLFYPMDFSPVCVQDHCVFGPDPGRLQPDGDTMVFGVSCDQPYAHKAFKEQFNIPYDLLADPTRRMVKAYGMFAGEEPFNCSKRGTVVIDKDGKVAHHSEQPMDKPRTARDIAQAIADPTQNANRAGEFGLSVE